MFHVIVFVCISRNLKLFAPSSKECFIGVEPRSSPQTYCITNLATLNEDCLVVGFYFFI